MSYVCFFCNGIDRCQKAGMDVGALKEKYLNKIDKYVNWDIR